jgi:hypothetical protein
MYLFRLVIGNSFVAVGFALTLAAFVLIANTGGGSPYMYVVWGLGLLTMMLGFKSLPEKKTQRRESPLAGRSHGRPDNNSQDFPATGKQKSLARELGIKFPPSISKGDLSDLITKERASER